MDSANISEDLQSLNNWLKTDRAFRDTLDFSINFNLSFLNSSAWEVAKLNQSLTFLGNKKVQDISEVYLAQSFLDNTGTKVFGQMKEVVKVDNSKFMDLYEEEMRAFKFDLGLIHGAVTAYLSVSRVILNNYPSSSGLAVQ